jgi:hypothetical protein
MGIDNSDSDKLKISGGTALGTNDTWIMDTSGRRIMPLQPCFLASLSAIRTNVTGDGTDYTVVYDATEFDQATNFSGGTTFTAPVTGKYFFTFSITVFNLSVAHVRATCDIPFYSRTELNPRNVMSSTGFCTMLTCKLASLTAGATVITSVGVHYGTKTVSVGGAGYDNYFSGWLVC